VDMMVAPPRGTFVWHEVSTAVNRVANDSADLILPCSEEDIAIAEAASRKQPKESPRKAKVSAPEDNGQGSLF